MCSYRSTGLLCLALGHCGLRPTVILSAGHLGRNLPRSRCWQAARYA
jgi:hypothetical protein